MKKNKLISSVTALYLFLSVFSIAKAEESGEFDPFAESGWSFSYKGYYKNLFVFSEFENYYGKNFSPEKDKKVYADLNRIRFSPEIQYSDFFIVHVDYDNEVISSNYLNSYEFDYLWKDKNYNDFLKLSYAKENKSIYYRTKIHNAYLKLTLKNLVLSVGRQQVRFGSGKLWNPLDILNPISPVAFEGAEEQKAIDSVRLDLYLTENTELSMVYNPKRFEDEISQMEKRSSNYLVRLKQAFNRLDLSLLSAYVSKREVYGSDVSLILFDGILRGSFLYNIESDAVYVKKRSYCLGSAGFEYSFSTGFTLNGEFFYNENSLNDNSELKQALDNSFFYGVTAENYYLLSNQFFTYNSYYYGLNMSYQSSPLVTLNFFIIYDNQGEAVFYNPSMSYNLFQNTDLSFSFYYSTLFNRDRSSDFTQYEDNPLFQLSLISYY